MNLNAVLAWLQAQASAIFATIGNVVSDRPEPARQVVVYVAVLAVLVFVIPRIIKLVSK